MYDFKWDLVAIATYQEEVDFILLKWNYKEVEKFHLLVEENLKRLSKNPEIGIFDKLVNVYSIVISKQTTLFYSFNTESKIIELHVFSTIKKILQH